MVSQRKFYFYFLKNIRNQISVDFVNNYLIIGIGRRNLPTLINENGEATPEGPQHPHLQETRVHCIPTYLSAANAIGCVQRLAQLHATYHNCGPLPNHWPRTSECISPSLPSLPHLLSSWNQSHVAYPIFQCLLTSC